MTPQNQHRGIGPHQMERNYKAKHAIYEVLSDGQWHRIKELKQKTKISPTTLYNKLKEFEKLYLIERKEDIEKGKYAVLYKAIPELQTTIRIITMTKKLNQALKQKLAETKDPLLILDIIHGFNQINNIYVLKILSLLKKKDKKVSSELIEFYEESLIWYPYKSLTFDLIASSMEIIDDINIHQLLVSQEKRQKEEPKASVETYEELIMNHFLNLLPDTQSATL